MRCTACAPAPSPLNPSADDEEEAPEYSGDEGVIAQFIAGQEEELQMIDATSRLAVVDLEWERIRAVDIFAVRGL